MTRRVDALNVLTPISRLSNRASRDLKVRNGGYRDTGKRADQYYDIIDP